MTSEATKESPFTLVFSRAVHQIEHTADVTLKVTKHKWNLNPFQWEGKNLTFPQARFPFLYTKVQYFYNQDTVLATNQHFPGECWVVDSKRKLRSTP